MAGIADLPAPEQVEVLDPREALLRDQTGYKADGTPAPRVAMVDTQAPPAPQAHSHRPPASIDISRLPVPPKAPDISHLPAPPPSGPVREPPGPIESGIGNAANYAREGLGGVADAALSGVSRVAAGVVAPPVALINRLVAAVSGGNPNEAAAAAHDYVTSKFVHNATTPVGKEIGNTVSSALAPVGESAEFYKNLAKQGLEKVGASPETAEGMLGETGDLAGTVGAITGGLSAANAGRQATTDAATFAASNAVKTPTAVTRYGARTGAEQPIARSLADKSAQPTVTAHNQALADPTIGAQAGVGANVPLTQKVLEDAQGPANSVYSRAENSLPTAMLSPKAAGMVNSVGGEDLIARSPDVQTQVSMQKQRLLSGPMSGSQVVNTSKSLRYNGFRNAASEDPEQNALGDAQLKMADALHQHMVDSLQENSPVSAEQLADARRALAQNYTVGSLLKGNNVDLQALARLYRNQPNLLTGPLRDWAEFADLHPEVTSLPSKEERFNPSGFAKDLTSIDLKRPVTYLQPFAGSLARRALTGGAAPTPQVPVTGLGGEFAPLAPRQPPPLNLSPPGGQAFEPNQGGSPLPQGPGRPFQAPLELNQPPGQAFEPHQQGAALPQAPEPSLPLGTALSPERPLGQTKAGSKQRGSFSLREIPGNGNEASGGASVEAFNRGTRNLVTWNGDTATPIARDVNQIDRQTPPKGSVTLDADTGELVSSGSTPRDHVKGLLARWRASKNDLGRSF